MIIENIPAYGKSKPRLYRFFEMIPGLAIWMTFILSIALSFFIPHVVIIFIILFDLYWLVRVLYFILNVIIAWGKYRKATTVDWQSEMKKCKGWDDIRHLVIFPTYGEPYGVLETTFKTLCRSNYPLDRLIVVLAGEEREGEIFLAKAEKIEKEFGGNFKKFLITVHPDNLAGEIKGKGANTNFAGKKSKQYIDMEKIPYENVIVSNFDIDTCAHPNYFAALTYVYLNHPNRLRTSFQPVALYNNNIWESSTIVRVAAFGTTFWLFTELARPNRLFTFSSHSMPFKALVDVGFWQKDIVTDDSRIFLQCLLRYDGDYTVTPLYIPVSMDTAMIKGRWKSLINLYKQQRRWAWGVEHFPYMLWYFNQNKKIPWVQKFKYLWNLGEGMYSWATAPILIFVLGRLPLIIAEHTAPYSVLLLNTPHILKILMDLAMVGIFISTLLSLSLLPKCPHFKTMRRIPEYFLMIVQWILLPVTLILFGSIPAIEAQTRLLFGKYLGFWVTKKAR